MPFAVQSVTPAIQCAHACAITPKVAVTGIDRQILVPFARKYVWWKTPEDAVAKPWRVVAQVMDIGDYEDVQRLVRLLGEDAFRDAIAAAEAGQFNARSWAYWHYRLGLAEPGCVPPMPRRRLT